MIRQPVDPLFMSGIGSSISNREKKSKREGRLCLLSVPPREDEIRDGSPVIAVIFFRLPVRLKAQINLFSEIEIAAF